MSVIETVKSIFRKMRDDDPLMARLDFLFVDLDAFIQQRESFRLGIIQLDLDSEEWDKTLLAELGKLRTQPDGNWREVMDGVWRDALAAA